MVLISSFELITLHVLNYLDDFPYYFLNDALDNIFGQYCCIIFWTFVKDLDSFWSCFTQQALNWSTFDLVMSLNQIFLTASSLSRSGTFIFVFLFLLFFFCHFSISNLRLVIFSFFLLEYFPFSNWNIFLFLIGIFSFFLIRIFSFF